jgi:hypothetical protein
MLQEQPVEPGWTIRLEGGYLGGKGIIKCQFSLMRSQHILQGGCDKGMTLLQRRGAPFEGLEWKEGTIGGTGVFFPVPKRVTRSQSNKMLCGN